MEIPSRLAVDRGIQDLLNSSLDNNAYIFTLFGSHSTNALIQLKLFFQLSFFLSSRKITLNFKNKNGIFKICNLIVSSESFY